ncbi:hypothetical protein [Dialister sp.]|uniref:hypothetical protein n=1 Tax=Dialister sp. TaxID=1955814 RepID=UPI003A5C25AE
MREPFLSTKFHTAWNNLFFENCIEETKRKKDISQEMFFRRTEGKSQIEKAKKVKV